MCYAWYFGELAKLRAYHVVCYVFQVVLRIAGRRRLDCTHQLEIMILRILGFYQTLLTCVLTTYTFCGFWEM